MRSLCRRALGFRLLTLCVVRMNTILRRRTLCLQIPWAEKFQNISMGPQGEFTPRIRANIPVPRLQKNQEAYSEGRAIRRSSGERDTINTNSYHFAHSLLTLYFGRICWTWHFTTRLPGLRIPWGSSTFAHFLSQFSRETQEPNVFCFAAWLVCDSAHYERTSSIYGWVLQQNKHVKYFCCINLGFGRRRQQVLVCHDDYLKCHNRIALSTVVVQWPSSVSYKKKDVHTAVLSLPLLPRSTAIETFRYLLCSFCSKSDSVSRPCRVVQGGHPCCAFWVITAWAEDVRPARVVEALSG